MERKQPGNHRPTERNPAKKSKSFVGVKIRKYNPAENNEKKTMKKTLEKKCT